MNGPKITIATLRGIKKEGRRFSMLTCYDFTTAELIEQAGIESILVGDTYGEVCLGHRSTLPVRMDDLIPVTAAVRRGAPNLFLVGDMPFMSYQANEDDAVWNAGRFMTEAGCDCVKLEVDRRHLRIVERLSAAAVPVMAHLGLRPQSIHQLGGYRVQGKSAEAARRILEDARLMEEAGAVALLIEAVPTEVAEAVCRATELPVIGCVSGPLCDGQVVVLHDILGLNAGHPPSSVRVYAELRPVLLEAFRKYAADVNEGRFPIPEKSVGLSPEELARFHESGDGG